VTETVRERLRRCDRRLWPVLTLVPIVIGVVGGIVGLVLGQPGEAVGAFGSAAFFLILRAWFEPC
jgi:hypothetical protein